MERRRALALASASTLVLGSAVVAFAAVAGSFLGFGGGHDDSVGTFAGTLASAAEKPAVKSRTRHHYDRYPVETPADSSPSAPRTTAPSAARFWANDTGDTPTAGLQEQSESEAAPPGTPVRNVESETPARDDDAPPTSSRVTPTTRPPGVPDDWPANKPIPPMPPNCRQPQLEDNGVWNCQDAEDHDD